ncbi:MAG: hypothetical protein Q7T71_07780 [Herbiconiux sp.]|nr:hypothetical protein [Herbiconiux sp.]
MRRLRMRVLLVVAVAVAVAGLVTVLLGASTSVSFGWFAYAPLSGTTFTPEGIHVVTTAQIVGFAVLGAGLVALAFWLGLTLGRRTAAAERPTSDRAPAE